MNLSRFWILLSLSILHVPLFAQDGTFDPRTHTEHLFSHLSAEGMFVLAVAPEDELQEVLQVTAELRLRASSLRLAEDPLLGNALWVDLNTLSLSNGSIVWTLSVTVSSWLTCTDGRGHPNQVAVQEKFGVASSSESMRATVRERVAEFVDHIANQILKHRPDLQVQPPTPDS